jgi:hypothetical protein
MRTPRKPWRPGTLCKFCKQAIATLSDKYQTDRNICRTCGTRKRQEMREALRLKHAKPCAGCAAPITSEKLKRIGLCEKCHAARKCNCGALLTKRHDVRTGECVDCRSRVREARYAARTCAGEGCAASMKGRSYGSTLCAKCAGKTKLKALQDGRAAQLAAMTERRPMATHAVQVPMNTGEYRPPMTRAQALAADVGEYDPARVAWIDAVCARRRVGARG